MKKTNTRALHATLGVFAMVLTATALQQMPGSMYARIRVKDSAAYIPMWSFFAPRPATRDYEPLHRFVYANGSSSEWKQTLGVRNRSLLSNLWAPKRRLVKAVFDMTSDLLPLIHERDTSAIEAVPAYTGIRDYVLRLARDSSDPDVTGVQFLVALHAGFDSAVEPEILFISKTHHI